MRTLPPFPALPGQARGDPPPSHYLMVDHGFQVGQIDHDARRGSLGPRMSQLPQLPRSRLCLGILASTVGRRPATAGVIPRRRCTALNVFPQCRQVGITQLSQGKA